MQTLSTSHITIDDISHLFEKKIEAAVLRLDKLHPVISGNKWFKLRYYLEDAKKLGKKSIITFGGTWSNHIIATAAACKMEGLNVTGIIRGEEPSEWSPTLLQAREWGMQFVFTNRVGYREKEVPGPLITPDSYVIPEGGYGLAGAEGAATITSLLPAGQRFTHYCCAAGTGTMSAGLINAASPDQQVISISVMKNNKALEKMISLLLVQKDANKQASWQLLHDYHFDGYAKYQPALLEFMNNFYRQTGIPSDFVYTGKLFYAVNDLIQKDIFPIDSKLLIIHSGGLQGNASLRKGTLIF